MVISALDSSKNTSQDAQQDTIQDTFNIVVIGGGIAGLAAADAIVESVWSSQPFIKENIKKPVKITLLEASESFGGRANSWYLDTSKIGKSQRAKLAAPPYTAPLLVSAPHGMHFLWASYKNTYRFLQNEINLGLLQPAPPTLGSTTYCSWMSTPDLVETDTSGAVAAMHICDPTRPEKAWYERARRVLRAAQKHPRTLKVLEQIFVHVFGVKYNPQDALCYMDVLFAVDVYSPHFRWMIFTVCAGSAFLGNVESSRIVKILLEGRNPSDVEIGELIQPFFQERVYRPAERLAKAPVQKLPPLLEKLIHGPFQGDGNLPWAMALLLHRLVEDAVEIAQDPGYFNPRKSGYVKNIVKASYSSPFALDAATAIRHIQFGLRSYTGSMLRLFDGDDSNACWESVRKRIEQRSAECALRGTLSGEVHTHCKVLSIDIDPESKAVKGVVVQKLDQKLGQENQNVEKIRADVVISAVLPAALANMLKAAPPSNLRSNAQKLAAYANPTLNLQLVWRKKLQLPWPAMPKDIERTDHPYSISNLEGPFTILGDMQYAWSEERFRQIKLSEDDPDNSFAGTFWELTGSYADLYTHDSEANHTRYQWPLAVREKLAALLHDPSDFDLATQDRRPWYHDVPTDLVGGPPFMSLGGQVLPEKRAAYAKKWQQAMPIIVANTLRQLASMPHTDPHTQGHLQEQATKVEAGIPDADFCYTLRLCNEPENTFFSAEPHLYHLRPHARMYTEYANLFVAGDWTRNGLNLQCMESALISGLQAGTCAIEQIRRSCYIPNRLGQFPNINLPHIDQSVMPEGAWDIGP